MALSIKYAHLEPYDIIEIWYVMSVQSWSRISLSEGIVYSMGYGSCWLGRSTSHVKATMFGEVPMGERILAMACGASHCLALSSSKARYTYIYICLNGGGNKPIFFICVAVL